MRVLLILCVACVLFVHGLGSTALWDPDEPRQAIMAREMMERGDYVHPYLNGIPYLEKPPLHPWLIVATAKVTGRIDEFSSRLPSAIAALLLLLLVYLYGAKTDHEVSGFLSALILATNYQFLGNARESVMDMTFALFIGAAIILGYFCIERRKLKWLLPFALLPCAGAILSKGPAGLVIPLVVLFFYCLATKRLRSMFLPMTAGCLLSAAVASVWFFMAGKDYANEFIMHQNVARFATGFDHIQPFWYYFPKLFVNFLPWSIALPFAAWFAYKRKLWLPLIWLVFTFVFFDISRSKRAIYLLSAYPACAILVGIYLKERWYALAEERWTRLVFCVFGGAPCPGPAAFLPCLWAGAPRYADVRRTDAPAYRHGGGPVRLRGLLCNLGPHEISGKELPRALCLPPDTRGRLPHAFYACRRPDSQLGPPDHRPVKRCPESRHGMQLRL